MSEKTVPERVAWGAAWLDDHYPGWHAKIDLSILDISNCTRCVLGQVYTGVIPQAEQGQVLAQAIFQATDGWLDAAEYAQEYRQDVASGELGGYNILVDLHGLCEDGVLHGFVTTEMWPYDEAAEKAEYAALLDEWTQVIISRRLAEHSDVKALTVKLADLREPVSIV